MCLIVVHIIKDYHILLWNNATLEELMKPGKIIPDGVISADPDRPVAGSQ